MNKWRFWIAVAVITLIALGARLGLAISMRPWSADYERLYFGADSEIYHNLGAELATRGGWSEPSQATVTVYAPGYPFFLGLLYRIFGVSISIAVFANCILSVLSCTIIMIAVRLAIGERAALITGAVAALHPHSIRFACMVFSESLFMFLCSLMLLSFALGWRYREAKWSWIWGIVVASLFAALSATTRVALLYFAPLVAVLWYAFTLPSWRLRFLYSGGFLMFFALWLAPWALHNKARYDTYRLSISGEYNFLTMFVAYGMTPDGATARQFKWQLLQEAEERARLQNALTPFEKAPYYLAVAREKMQQHPEILRRAVIEGFMYFWFRATVLGSDERAESVKRDLRTRLYEYYSLLFQSALLLTWLVSVFLWRTLPKVWIVLATVSVIYFSLALGSANYSRYFLQSLPFLLPLAGLCGARLWEVMLQKFKEPAG